MGTDCIEWISSGVFEHVTVLIKLSQIHQICSMYQVIISLLFSFNKGSSEREEYDMVGGR